MRPAQFESRDVAELRPQAETARKAPIDHTARLHAAALRALGAAADGSAFEPYGVTRAHGHGTDRIPLMGLTCAELKRRQRRAAQQLIHRQRRRATAEICAFLAVAVHTVTALNAEQERHDVVFATRRIAAQANHGLLDRAAHVQLDDHPLRGACRGFDVESAIVQRLMTEADLAALQPEDLSELRHGAALWQDDLSVEQPIWALSQRAGHGNRKSRSPCHA